ncbi:MAG TPA: hypothetical protein VGK30_17900 [Candidatus Binatia bacterium]
MSISGVSGSSDAAWQQFQKVRSDLNQVGQDLQSGNVPQASADYATLEQDLPSSSIDPNSPFGQKLAALGQALQSGDLSGAQQAYSTLNQSRGAGGHHHHHHHQAQGSGSKGQPNSPLDQVLNQLGQDLQSEDLSGAQQDFAALLKQLGPATSYDPAGAAPAAATQAGSTVSTVA